MTKKILLIGLTLGLLFYGWSCTTSTKQTVEKVNFPSDYPVLHPKLRTWPAPALGITVNFNPPALLWPSRRKKSTTYNVRLSQDSTFQSDQTMLVKEIPWTIFNPHIKLNSGVWFWQYKINGEDWSALNRFVIPPEAVDFNAPSIETFWSAIPPVHPRALMDAKELPSFRNEVGQMTDAQVIITNADKKLNTIPPEEQGGKSKIKGKNQDQNEKLSQNASKNFSDKIYHTIDPFCKAYILTNDEKYAQPAIRWAMKVASFDPNGITNLSDFGDARCMLSMALVFDTFNKQLTQHEKSTLLAAIKFRADRIYNDWINYTDAKLLSNHVWQYILNNFMTTAIAVYGDIDEAKNWINYGYELWLARAPILGGEDGGWANGASYFRLNMETLLDVPMIIKNYTGFDFIKKHPWYLKNPYWMIYAFPPGSSSDGFGDDVERIFSPQQEYLAYAEALSKLTGSEAAAWYANKISETEKIKVSDADMLRWFRLRYLRNLNEAPVSDPQTWKQSMAFYDAGVVEMHTNLTSSPKDLMVAMRSSPYGTYSHMMADMNTFNVLYGGKRLFYTSGYKVTMSDPHRQLWYKHTRGHNGILIDDEGQPYDVEAYGWIARFLDGKTLSYAVGDASQAYSSQAEKQNAGLKKFRRHILFLRPDIIVVYDVLEADHDASWSWLIHSPQKIILDSARNEFQCNLENASSRTELFGSKSFHWTLTDTFAIPVKNWTQRRDDEGNVVEYKNDQWHLTAKTNEKTSKMRFLAIIQVLPDDQNAVKIVQDPSEKNQFTIGNWILHAEINALKPAVLEVQRNDDQVAFTSSGSSLSIGDQQFQGKIAESSKLIEFSDGNPVFSECGEQIPSVVREIPITSRKVDNSNQ